jgi:hypothetical protein
MAAENREVARSRLSLELSGSRNGMSELAEEVAEIV